MTLARRLVWGLIGLMIVAVCCAVTGDAWQHSGDERSDGRPIAREAATSARDLTGRWGGTWESTRYTAEGSLTALLRQSASSLTGEVTILGTACWSVGEVSGNVSGDAVVFGAVFASDVQANFVGTVAAEGLAVEGSYDVSGGACAGDIGTWRVIKTAEPCDANGDGTIDRQDALDLLGFLLQGGDPLSGDADCNRDGVPNFWDVLAILRARSV